MKVVRPLRPDPVSPRGFTLIEIMLVVVVLGLLAGLALPKMRSAMERANLQKGAREVTGLLRFARSCAVMRESQAEIRFSPETDRYQLVLHDEQGRRLGDDRRRWTRRRDARQRLVSREALRPRTLPKGVHFPVIYSEAPLSPRSDLPRVIYFPDGSATPATIALEDENGLAMSVEVFRTTGLARVGPGLPEEEPQRRTIYIGPERRIEAEP